MAAAAQGAGGVLFIVGEAGIGKTRLAEHAIEQSGLRRLRGAASERAAPPYSPVVEVLRSHLRQIPNAFADCGPVGSHLSLLLPELGAPPESPDPAALIESVRCAFESIGREKSTVVLLDDLQWADNATLELLSALDAGLAQMPVIIVGIYRSDEIPRGHPVRRLRDELRRAGRLREITVGPLDERETAALVEAVLGGTASGQLSSNLFERTLGVPLFVEELAKVLVESGRLNPGDEGYELTPGEQIPIPESVRDAVLLRYDKLSEEAREVLEVAAVAGFRFDLELVVEKTQDATALEQLMQSGLIREVESGIATFHHALTHEAIYDEIMWTRRRALHAHIAERLEMQAAPPSILADHWQAAGEPEQARQALLADMQASCDVHAYRDALEAGERALDLWPDGDDQAQRLEMLDQLGHCAQLSGLSAEAARAWREVAEGRRNGDDTLGWAQAERRLATAYEMQGAWERALTARKSATEAFLACGMPAEACSELLARAGHLASSGRFRAALQLAIQAVELSQQAERPDLNARAVALRGYLVAKMGDPDRGQELVQSALSAALAEDLVGPAAEIYQRLASVLEQAADYQGALQAYETAISYCETRGEPERGQVCLACLALVLRQTGEWKRASELSREVRASPQASALVRGIAACQLGIIHANRGQSKSARQLLAEGLAQGRREQLAVLEVDAAWGLAIVDQLEGASRSGADHFAFVLERWQHTEDVHYAVPALRWGSTFLAGLGDEAGVVDCVESLASIATTSPNPETLAAVAHALGESALLDGEAEVAAAHFRQAVENLHELELPFERAKSQVRAGVALIEKGEREEAVAQLVSGYHTARILGARPLAAEAAELLASQGEAIEARARGVDGGGRLTPRQLEVLRLVSEGMTNREVAQQLFLSPRTVDMHVGNILDRLNCRSRTDAVRRASELGLLDNRE